MSKDCRQKDIEEKIYKSLDKEDFFKSSNPDDCCSICGSTWDNHDDIYCRYLKEQVI